MSPSKATTLFFILITLAIAQTSEAQWSLTGNTPAANEFIGTTDASNFRFRTSNTERMVILSDGNIGIGITNPTNKLEVNGSFKNNGEAVFGNGSSFGWTMTGAGGYDQLISYRAAGAFISTANGPLYIVGKPGDDIRMARYVKINSDNNGLDGLILTPHTINTAAVDGTRELLIGANQLNALKVFQNGNVTVQTGGTYTDAGYKLDVTGTMRASTSFTFGTTYGGTWDIWGTHARFNANASTDAITISTAKNPGSIRLQVNNGARGIMMDGSSTNFLFMGGSGETLGGIGNANGTGSLTMLYSTAPNSRTEGARLSNNGNFGINTSSPAYRLDVNGSARFGGTTLPASMVVTANGDIGIGMTPTTNMAMQVLKNANATVGIRFENTNTGSNAFAALQLGQDISTTGTKFLNVGYANPAITPYGVYQPAGSFIVNNGAGGLNMAATSNTGTPKMRFFTGYDVIDANMRMLIDENGQVGIGTTSIADNNYKLFVENGIRTRKIKVDQNTWPDYVFAPGYLLPTLKEVETFIAEHKHLPGMPSATEVQQTGLDLGDNQANLLKKIEELTLYMIELNKKVEKLSEENAGLKRKLEAVNK